jgi:eukaryotic-like serine/threonine-protein kinase
MTIAGSVNDPDTCRTGGRWKDLQPEGNAAAVTQVVSVEVAKLVICKCHANGDSCTESAFPVTTTLGAPPSQPSCASDADLMRMIRKNGWARCTAFRRVHLGTPVAFILLTCAALMRATADPAPTATRDTGTYSASVRSIVLAAFENQTSDSSFDHSLTQAVLLEFSQSPYLSVLPERQVTDALHGLERPKDAPMTAELARAICLRTDSQSVIDGQIRPHGRGYALLMQAIACQTGALVATVQAEPDEKNKVLGELHRASSRLRAELGEPAASLERFGVSAESTTGSLEALEDYSLGLAARRAGGDGPGIPFFKQALAHDPQFPMAKTMLASIYGNLRQPSVAIAYATQAYELRNRLGERERFHIAGVYFRETGQMEPEIHNYERWRSVYPGDSVPYNNLGNDYAALGQLDKSLQEYLMAQRLSPSAVGYTNVAGMQLALNRFDDAAATLQQAFAQHFDGRYLHQTLYWLAFVRGDAAQMDQQVAWAKGKSGDEDPLLSMQADTESYFGHFTTARRLTQQAVESAEHAGSKETAALWQVNDALREAEIGNTALARQGVASALALSRGRDVELMGAFALARNGACSQTAELLQRVKREYPTDSLLSMYWFPTIQAACDVTAAHPTAALSTLKPVLPYDLGGAGTFINYVYPAYVRGEAYLKAGDGEAAVSEFRKVLDHRGIVVNFVTGALVHLELARAYVTVHDAPRAREEYQEFLRLWKDADPEIPVLLQAQDEYARLH